MATGSTSQQMEYDQYITKQLRRTGGQVKLVGQATRLLSVVAGLLGVLLLAGLVEHWFIMGGYSSTVRWVLFFAIIGSVGFYLVRFLVPIILGRINPMYAAKTIEEQTPGMKNSLLNLLFLRRKQEELAPAVYEAIEKQAAIRLSQDHAETTIDRTSLIRALFIFLSFFAISGLYKVFSPKDPIVTAGRVLMPWADIRPPTRVTIENISPGDEKVARGKALKISAVVRGIREGETVVLKFSTEDGQSVDEQILMTPDATGYRHECLLPEGAGKGSTSTGANGLPTGVQQDFTYRIEAGDARSESYNVSLVDHPTIVLEKVVLDYPEYTGYARSIQKPGGDIKAIDGTRVTLHIQTNDPIGKAFIDLDGDGLHKQSLTTSTEKPRQAQGRFTLSMREDRRTPMHHSYLLRYKNKFDQSNREPVRYRIDVEPDYAPEVVLLEPTEDGIEVPLSQTIKLEVEARDPDFALEYVTLHGEVEGNRTFKEVLLNKKHVGRFVRAFRFTPSEHGLKNGDVVTYWASAEDIRSPEPNRALTQRKTIRIVADPESESQEGEQGDQQKDQNGEQPQDGNQGDPQEDEPHVDQSEKQPEEQQGESGEGDGGEGQGSSGSGGEGESQEGESETGEGSEGKAGGGEQNENQQDGQGGQGGEQQGEQNAEGGEQDTNGEPQDSPPQNSQGESGEQRAEGGEPNESEGQPSEDPVANDGSDDGSAFEKIQKHLEESKEEQGKEQGAKSEEQAGQEGEGQEQEQEGQNQGKENEVGEPGDSSPQNKQGKGDEQEAESKEPNDDGQAEGKQKGEGKEQEAKGGEQQEGQEKGEGKGESGEGNPDQQKQKQRDEQARDSQEGQEPSPEGKEGKESDSQSDQSGDKKGGGQEGDGQKAPREGTGSAGQNQSADEGNGASEDKGNGETTDNPGEGKPAGKETGETNGEKSGEGTTQKNKEGGEGESESGKEQSGKQNAEGNEQPGKKEENGPNKDKQSTESEPRDSSPKNEQGENGKQSAEGKEQDGDPGEQQEGKQNGQQEGPQGNQQGNPKGGRESKSGPGKSNANGTDEGNYAGDDANLDYAKKQTDLILEKLNDQLDKREVDQELLDKLKWTKEDLRKFVDRWNARKKAAKGDSNTTDAAKQKLDDALRSLGLKKGRLRSDKTAGKKEKLQNLRDAYRGSTPPEFQQQVRKYSREVAKSGDDKE